MNPDYQGEQKPITGIGRYPRNLIGDRRKESNLIEEMTFSTQLFSFELDRPSRKGWLNWAQVESRLSLPG